MDSQTKSSSTDGPPELESPQEITGYTSDLPGYVAKAVPAKKLRPEPEKEEEQPTDLVVNDPNVQVLLSQMKANGIAMPRVRVVENGKETVGELDVGLIAMVTDLAQLGQLSRIRKSLEREQFEGKLLSKDLLATDAQQSLDLTKSDPFTPWVTATFKNDGPDAVFLAINNQRPYHQLNKGDSLPADFTKAKTRIFFIEYYCNSGETATVRSLGKY